MSEKQPGITPSMLPNLAACRAFEPGASCSSAAKRGVRIDKAIREAWTAKNGGMLFSADFFLSELTPKDREAVEWALQELDSVQQHNPGTELYTDGEHIKVGSVFPEIGTGTLDGINPKAGILVEFKTGENRDYREQVAAYAAACCQKYGKWGWNSIILYVDKQETTSICLTAAQAEKIVRRTLAAPFKRTPGPHCQWCGAKCWLKDKAKGK